MPIPNRNIEGYYSYKYQGQEKDIETGMEAFQLRLWDSRIGRWLTVGPYRESHSPYLGMGNNPISLIDTDGGSTSDSDPIGDAIRAKLNLSSFEHLSYGGWGKPQSKVNSLGRSNNVGMFNINFMLNQLSFNKNDMNQIISNGKKNIKNRLRWGNREGWMAHTATWDNCNELLCRNATLLFNDLSYGQVAAGGAKTVIPNDPNPGKNTSFKTASFLANQGKAITDYHQFNIIDGIFDGDVAQTLLKFTSSGSITIFAVAVNNSNHAITFIVDNTGNSPVFHYVDQIEVRTYTTIQSFNAKVQKKANGFPARKPLQIRQLIPNRN